MVPTPWIGPAVHGPPQVSVDGFCGRKACLYNNVHVFTFLRGISSLFMLRTPWWSETAKIWIWEAKVWLISQQTGKMEPSGQPLKVTWNGKIHLEGGWHLHMDKTGPLKYKLQPQALFIHTGFQAFNAAHQYVQGHTGQPGHSTARAQHSQENKLLTIPWH